MERFFYDRPIAWRKRIPWILLLPGGLLLHLAAVGFRGFADGYAGFVFPLASRGFALLTGWIPFCVAEVLFFVFVVRALVGLWVNVRRVRRKRRHLSNVAVHALVDLLALVGFLYGSGMLLWGVVYHRTPLAQRVGYDVSPPTDAELRSLGAKLIEEANAARLLVAEDEDGVMRVSSSRKGALRRAWQGMDRAGQLYAPLETWTGGRVKGLTLTSTPLSYLGVSGIYVMFTGEPGVNMKLPDPALPFTACHELAHQAGLAREEEANFAGWLVCANHPDPDFRYSGQLQAMRYALGALRRADPGGYDKLVEGCSPAVRRDWDALRIFWRGYESRVTDVSRRIYDLFLKSQGQQAGAQSYGMMVDLLVAHSRASDSRPEFRAP